MSAIRGKQINHVKDAVDLIFKKYDEDRNGVLEQKEVMAMLVDTYASLNMGLEVNE
jgi:hypothetical protein